MMCLAKKTAKMPTKEEHEFLLFYNLGLRNWKVDMNWNWLTFSQVVYNLYPRLRSVGGYNLYIASKEKKLFEPIPEEFNTPKKIRSHLGPLFSVLLSPSGCLIIVPEVVRMEEQVKKNKEELVNFFTKTLEYQNKNDADCKQTEPAPGLPMANGHGPFPGYPGPGNSSPQAQGFPQMMTDSDIFLVQSMAFMNLY